MNSSNIDRRIIFTPAQRLHIQLHICLTFRAIIKQPECTNTFKQLGACSLDAFLIISMKMILN